ncbi:hypothetical protein [Stenotrophomonas sp. NA06056]|uniref:hypothetical protein n=1 Tax=Stenotrophomonas sp. NA06056 TaxID=2742129 RepID=UPI00158DF3A1|nr:hypothetical protein [Stenotrophomonas sp. NA06056]QKW55056.1 hypothetical protein HUT07_00010 [Stenotrophomonas sp. NA06056]
MQNPVASAGQGVDKNAVEFGGRFIHSFPHPLGAGNAEGFEALNPFVYKDLAVFSSDSGSTSTTKLLIYSTFFKA